MLKWWRAVCNAVCIVSHTLHTYIVYQPLLELCQWKSLNDISCIGVKQSYRRSAHLEQRFVVRQTIRQTQHNILIQTKKQRVEDEVKIKSVPVCES